MPNVANFDSMESILNDCTINPKVHCFQYDCGQGIYDELADYVPDMCLHLVGRTEAFMRQHMFNLVMQDGVDEYRIGDSAITADGRIGECMGFVKNDENRICLVLAMHDEPSSITICPIDDARKLKVPTPAQVRKLIMGAIQSAASGSAYDEETAERRADYILDVAHACFCGEPFPIVGAK